MAKKNAFLDWINEHGQVKVAEMLCVNRQAVHVWVKGEHLPHPDKMREIVRITRGRVTYKDIIENPAYA